MDDREHFFDIEVLTGSCDRYNLPVEITAKKIDGSIRIVEIDTDCCVIDDSIPCQLEPYSPLGNGNCLVFLMKGHTLKDASRIFRVLKNSTNVSDCENRLVSVQDNVLHEGQDSYKIKTGNAVYYFHKKGAAFASLIDSEGRDWISYHPYGGSDGKYRGIPNVVHPEVHFHPGPGSKGDKSTLLSSGPVRARIKSDTGDGLWSCIWDIYPEFARLTILKFAHPYWILYEGTPYGKLDETTNYYMTSDGLKRPASECFSGSLPKPKWIFFGDNDTQRFLYLYNHQNDDCIDSYRPMEGNMTVFGFGRKNIDKYLEQAPALFTIGLGKGEHFYTAKGIIDSVTKDYVINIKSLEADYE